MSDKARGMLQIDNTVISSALFDVKFVCNINKCKGVCCIEGDSGAPLDKKEAKTLKKELKKILPFMNEKGKAAVAKSGISYKDSDGDLVTMLVDNKECAFLVFENGTYQCAIEKAYESGIIKFVKPISCRLYPVRVKQYKAFIAVNYDEWDICSDALIKGEMLNMPVYKFLKAPLIDKFGEEWYNQVEIAAKEYFNNND